MGGGGVGVGGGVEGEKGGGGMGDVSFYYAGLDRHSSD